MKHFDLSEFDCPCGCCKNNMNDDLLDALDDARDMAGIPFTINSGCRCAEHNKAINGKPKSSHLLGYAVDIKATDSRSRYLIVESLLAANFNRIGIADTFIHVDNDPAKDGCVIWTY